MLEALLADREIIGTLWALLFAGVTACIFKYVLPPIERRWPALAPGPSGGIAKLRAAVLVVFIVVFLYVSSR
jgi:hypothetical protein